MDQRLPKNRRRRHVVKCTNRSSGQSTPPVDRAGEGASVVDVNGTFSTTAMPKKVPVTFVNGNKAVCDARPDSPRSACLFPN